MKKAVPDRRRRGFAPLAGFVAVSLVALGGFARAAEVSAPDLTGRPGERRPDVLERLPTVPPPTLTLPPVAPAPKGVGGLLRSVAVKRIVVKGSTVFSAQELSAVTAPYENRTLTMEDLEVLRRELTVLYVSRGYVNSGAVIPDQTISDGTVVLQIVEGTLGRIDVQGNHGLSESYVRKRVELGAGTPVNVGPLQERLQILQQDPKIQRVHAELRPGSRPGDGVLTVRVEERPLFSIWTAVNNYQSPSVGAERGIMTVAHQSFTGNGDPLSLTYGQSRGLVPMIDLWYSLPVNAWDTSVLLRYRKNDTEVVDDVFRALDIKSKSDAMEFAVRQPVYRSLSQEVALSLSLERERNHTSLSGEPFSFSPGVEDGNSTVAPLRFGQEWTHRTQRQVFAAKSRFSYGLNSLGATRHDDPGTPDGQFFAWLGQFQWARVFTLLDAQLLARLDVQRSSSPLLPVEQMGVGGRYTVRGYRENLLVRDQALVASVEGRLPLLQGLLWADYLQLCAFFDYGNAQNKTGETSGPEDLPSVGLGLRWAAAPVKGPLELRTEAEVYWGYGLKDVDQHRDDVQDDGFHFQFALTCLF